MSYTPDEILEFQMKDKRIMFQSIFSSLCNLYAIERGVESKDGKDLAKRAYEIVEELIAKYPMKEIKLTGKIDMFRAICSVCGGEMTPSKFKKGDYYCPNKDGGEAIIETIDNPKPKVPF